MRFFRRLAKGRSLARFGSLSVAFFGGFLAEVATNNLGTGYQYANQLYLYAEAGETSRLVRGHQAASPGVGKYLPRSALQCSVRSYVQSVNTDLNCTLSPASSSVASSRSRCVTEAEAAFSRDP